MIFPLHCKTLASVDEIPDHFYGLPMRLQVQVTPLDRTFQLLLPNLEVSEKK